eukprot:scaffold204231_cov39-Tisochrysis_lutea.AAC.1
MWNKLERVTVHTVFKDHACTDAFTAEECEPIPKSNNGILIYNTRESTSPAIDFWAHGQT